MMFSDLWRKCRAGDASACKKIYFYYYVLPRIEHMFRQFELDPPIVIPRPRPQPDPVPYDRLIGELQLFENLALSDGFDKFLTASPKLRLETLNNLKSEIANWSHQIEEDIAILDTEIGIESAPQSMPH